ncbi:MAG: hypothetical protein ACRDJV_06290 [Actinomycetota bacterium]
MGRSRFVDEQVPRPARIIAAAVLVGLLGVSCTEVTAVRPRAQIPEVSTRDIDQAPWRIKIKPTGTVAKVTRADRKRFGAQRPRLANLVRDVYDALFLFPSRQKKVIHKHFARHAAREVMSSKVGVPGRADLVQTRKRVASIGLQPNGAHVAAARVVVRVKGRIGARVFRLAHRGTLWVERSKRVWKVVGFEVSQTPVTKSRAQKNKKARDDAEKRDKKKRDPRRESPRQRKREA